MRAEPHYTAHENYGDTRVPPAGATGHSQRCRSIRSFSCPGTYRSNRITRRIITPWCGRLQVCTPCPDEVAIRIHLKGHQPRQPGIFHVNTFQSSRRVGRSDTETISVNPLEITQAGGNVGIRDVGIPHESVQPVADSTFGLTVGGRRGADLKRCRREIHTNRVIRGIHC